MKNHEIRNTYITLFMLMMSLFENNIKLLFNYEEVCTQRVSNDKKTYFGMPNT